MPSMTTGRAALVKLIQRYLAGLLDPFVSLLEVHKLMYFMQEAGQPLQLRYVKGPYGPYAENLSHVMNAIEGHMVSGYNDGGDAPNKPLELVPGAIEDANAFLSQYQDSLSRYERVTRLVEGFESPYGLELLSTVHWVATREGATDEQTILDHVRAWNAHKRQFTERHLAIATRQLGSQGWLSARSAEIQ